MKLRYFKVTLDRKTRFALYKLSKNPDNFTRTLLEILQKGVKCQEKKIFGKQKPLFIFQ